MVSTRVLFPPAGSGWLTLACLVSDENIFHHYYTMIVLLLYYMQTTTTFTLYVNHHIHHAGPSVLYADHCLAWPDAQTQPHFENTSPRKHNRNWKTQLTCSCNCKMPERTRPDRGAITSKFADHPSNPGVSTTQCQSVDYLSKQNLSSVDLFEKPTPTTLPWWV